MQKLALAIQRTGKQLLLLLGVTALADIVKEFFRAKLMDWAVSNFGGIGRWIIANPFALLTFGTILCLFWLLVAVMMQTTPVVSPILDSHDRQIVRPNIPGRWSLGII